MKFGKSLSNQIEQTLPEWRDKFLSYKELKKKLKLIQPNAGGGDRPTKRPRFEDAAGGYMTKEEVDFIKLLEDELEKFNSFFVEKEEEYIITLKELQDRVARAKDSNDELIKIRKEIVDFHGEMVLLENYSSLNYTGLAKILKKYDKRTGALIRLPFIQKVLQEPFFTTDMLYKLVKECEMMLDRLFPTKEAAALSSTDGDEACGPSSSSVTTSRNNGTLSEIEHMDSSYMKSTISALRVLKEIRSGSSTVSVFSLPPLQISGLDDSWKKVPILEQEAK
ncbi:SPX domain gene 2 [Euphorbia peplus]|nr:SPX domain gene 2 [Euphorbia peplus]